MLICIAPRCQHASNALLIPVCRRWSQLPSPQPITSPHCKTTDTGVVDITRLTGWWITRRACLLPQLSPGTHISYPQRDGWMPGSALRWFTRPKTVTRPTKLFAWHSGKVINKTMRLDSRVLDSSKPKNYWQDLTISIIIIGAEELHKQVLISRLDSRTLRPVNILGLLVFKEWYCR